MIGDDFLFLTAFSGGDGLMMLGAVLEFSDYMLTATDKWGVVFMMLVACMKQCLLVLLPGRQWTMVVLYINLPF